MTHESVSQPWLTDLPLVGVGQGHGEVDKRLLLSGEMPARLALHLHNKSCIAQLQKKDRFPPPQQTSFFSIPWKVSDTTDPLVASVPPLHALCGAVSAI